MMSSVKIKNNATRDWGESIILTINISHIQPGICVDAEIAEEVVDLLNSKMYPCKLVATLENVETIKPLGWEVFDDDEWSC